MFIHHPELNSRDAISSSTRGMPCAYPLSRAQLKGYIPSSTQGTPTSRPLRYLRSLIDHAHHSKHNTNLLQQNPLAGDTTTRCCRFQIAWCGTRTIRRYAP
ncbi:hypothetical protein DEO72_LG7g1632 [Vigna unguiculata]|uniref:Uncharacterized protein n=1 Tax=Vigna unguiculata TaxID=3917 RepID=A0A4D6MIF0_VIGUN|nr:hypothetical protein DEO72_LG7g1632 [Vigna unguiculata]